MSETISLATESEILEQVIEPRHRWDVARSGTGAAPISIQLYRGRTHE